MHPNRRQKKILLLLLTVLSVSLSPSAQAFFFDGKGFYGIKGQQRTDSNLSEKTGTHQAFDETFGLELNLKKGDHFNFYLDLQILEDFRASYMGGANFQNENSELCF